MSLSREELSLVEELSVQLSQRRNHDVRMSRYYEGAQRLAVLGLAVPPEMAGFETVVNWARIGVDELERRLDLRAFVMPGSEAASPELWEGWQRNGLDSEASLLHRDALIYGRSFVSISTNPDDPEQPLITPESPREIAIKVDSGRRRIVAALRKYRSHDAFGTSRAHLVLYLPDETVWIESGPGGWVESDRDVHNLGRVPLVAFLNRRRIGKWLGESEMSDLIPIVDSAARSLTNLQMAQETIAIPKRYVLGISKGDFVDRDGKQLPVWEAYMDAFLASSNKDAKIGQLEGANLDNFTKVVDFYGRLASSVTGLPVRYFGQNTANPAAEGAIRADESRAIKNAERHQDDFGGRWAAVMAFWLRFRTGEWPEGRISTLWFDAGTPTFAQKADALQKLAGGRPIISREGAWDELGWSEARKAREREYFAAEDAVPVSFAAQAAVQAELIPDERG